MTPRLARLSKLARIARATGELLWPPGPWLRDRGKGALVQVENTSFCNFHCSYCVTHSPKSLVPLRRGHMTIETYVKILDKNPRGRIVVLQGDGEPLLDPTVFEKIAIARDRGLATQIVTNGSLLKPAMLDKLRAGGPDLLLCSIDAVSPTANETNRAGLDYAKVTASLRDLCGDRGAFPKIIGLLSVVHGPFTDETAAALRDFDRIGIDILFYKQLNRAFEGRIDDYRGGEAGAVPQKLRAALSYPITHQRISTTKPCPQLRFELPYYLWDGQETACCILNSERYAKPEFQHAALLDRYRAKQMPSECEGCSYFGGYA